MLITWGPVSLKGGELSWSRANTNPLCPNRGEIPAEEYDNLYNQFNPTLFNPDEWMKTAKAAGMKYIVLVAKHCDGFLLWDSPSCDHNITATPFKRDIVAEVAAAARRNGLKVGMYFSPMDWRDPDFRTERNAAFVARMQEQLRELLTNYGKIDLMWFDFDVCDEIPYDQENTYQLVKSLHPEIIINNRLDLGRESNRLIKSRHADYYTPEHAIGEYDDQTPWESVMPMSSSHMWSYGGPSDGVKSFQESMDMLVRSVGGDGNLLLNAGPMPTGELPPNQIERLREIGAWMAKYGESIYGTRGGPFKPGDYGVSTRKGKTIYLLVQNWESDVLHLPVIAAKVVGSRVLTGGKVEVLQTADGIKVSVPKADRDPLYTIVALELDSDALTIPSIMVPRPPSLSLNAKAKASIVYRDMADFGPDKAVDGRDDTRWDTDETTKSAWLELDLGKPVTFDRVFIMEEYSEKQGVLKFALESWQDGKWKPFHEGTSIGVKFSTSFPPVTAQRVRLNVIEAIGGPTITEFLVFTSGSDG